MHITRTAARQQQKRIKSYRANCDSYSYFNLLTSNSLLDKVEELLPAAHRERLYPPTETLSMFLAQAMSADRSCQHIVNQAAVQRLAGGISAGSTCTGGYCLARKRLPQEMVSNLTQYIGSLINEHVPEQWCWQGQPVRIVDGTTLTMPDTPANQAAFPQQRGQQPGLGFPICRGQSLGEHDHIIVIDKPKKRPAWMSEIEHAAAPAILTLRELKAGGNIMVTTKLNPKAAPKSELKARYQSRWHVELDIRHIKETMGLGVLSCKSPEMVQKEIWVYLLAYNLIRLMMVQSALLADITPRTISFKHCLQLSLISVLQIDASDNEQLYILLQLIAQQRVGNRPGRIEPRAVKRRPKPFPLLTKSRAAAREDVRKYGHPRKRKA